MGKNKGVEVLAEVKGQAAEAEILPPEVITTKTGEPPLSSREEDEFRQDCETIIAELGSFIRVGNALRRIKEKKLYRTEFGSFEGCVKSLFDLAARRAQQLMQASEAVEAIESVITENANHGSHFLPRNERQVRALLAAPAQNRAEIWLKALEKTENGKPTARQIANVIREEIGGALDEERQKITRQPRTGKPELYPPFAEAFDAFWKQITDAYLDGWKKVPKKEVVKRLKSILNYIED